MASGTGDGYNAEDVFQIGRKTIRSLLAKVVKGRKREETGRGEGGAEGPSVMVSQTQG